MPGLENQSEKLVGVEASDSMFTAVCIDSARNTVDSRNYSIDRGSEILPQLIEFIKELKMAFGVFSKLGIAVPGLIHTESKRVAYSASVPEHSNVNIVEAIESATDLQVSIENDANAAAYGEFKLGAGRESNNMFYATIGSGVGGAFIFDGRIWYGAAGFAGEFGYVAINSDGMRLEDVASAANIVRRTRNRFNRDSTSSLGKLDERQMRITDIVSAADNGDDFAQLMLERTGHYVGTAIASVINLLNIEKIVVGGDIMHAKHIVLDAVIGRAKELSFAPSFERTEIVAGELDDRAAATGVALIANGK